MEVASPLPFNHTQAGAKRPFACSPIRDASGMDSAEDYSMDETSTYGHCFKRRRCGSNENMQMSDVASAPSTSSLANISSLSFGATPIVGSCGSPRSGASWKRQRRNEESHSETSTRHLQQVIETQSSEIQRLTTENSSIKSSFDELKTAHVNCQKENKILKKAVTIQQERQNHAASELDAARRYKDEAEERMKRLEQVIATLRYHLQAQQPCAGNDFMGFNHRPPDVY